MTKEAFPYKLYLVVSERDCTHLPLLEVVEQAVKAGVDLVQLREKTDPYELFLDKAQRLKELLDRYSVPLIINDNLQIAQQVEVYGIHVGQSDAPPSHIRQQWPNATCIGYSIEELAQLDNPQTPLADYLGISPVYKTPTKTDTITQWGLSGIAKLRSLTDKPLVAIGQMKAENAREVLRAGADCLAVVSAICGAEQPAKQAERIRNQIEKS